MQLLEYRVKVPVVLMKNYSSLLADVLKSENVNIVKIFQSGESDYANLPGRNNNLHSGIQRTSKEYNLPVISSTPISVTSFVKNLTSRSNINSNISVTSKCSNIDSIDNIFSLPISVISSRTVIPLDLTDPDIWNFELPAITPIITLPTLLPVPTKTPFVFVYILFTIYPPTVFGGSATTGPILDPNLFKAYIILLHKKMISLLQE
jgi:hypothetical protein